MMQRIPRASAPRAKRTMRSGVRCADTMVTSCGTPRDSRTSVAARIVGRSESEPIITATSGDLLGAPSSPTKSSTPVCIYLPVRCTNRTLGGAEEDDNGRLTHQASSKVGRTSTADSHVCQLSPGPAGRLPVPMRGGATHRLPTKSAHAPDPGETTKSRANGLGHEPSTSTALPEPLPCPRRLSLHPCTHASQQGERT